MANIIRRSFSLNKPVDLLRILVAVFMGIHSIARMSLGIVDDFGTFLDATGYPLPLFLAWLITILEITGAILLIANTWVRYVSIYFIFQLVMGVLLVHLEEGWFVVGAGRNGMEYSVLLIICFVAIIWNDILVRKSS